LTYKPISLFLSLNPLQGLSDIHGERFDDAVPA
jgi:hypothetical protein